MTEISPLSTTSRLTSKPRVSMEATDEQKAIDPSPELKQFQIEMDQIDHAFALVKEIRLNLEGALKKLSPDP